MKIFKSKKVYNLDIEFIPVALANLSFLLLSFFIISIPKIDSGIVFGFQSFSGQVQSPVNMIGGGFRGISYASNFTTYEASQLNSNYVRISVNNKGDFFFEDEPVSFKDIGSRVKQSLIEDTSITVVISVHQDASYDSFIKVFDEVSSVFYSLGLEPKLAISIIRR